MSEEISAPFHNTNAGCSWELTDRNQIVHQDDGDFRDVEYLDEETDDRIVPKPCSRQKSRRRRRNRKLWHRKPVVGRKKVVPNRGTLYAKLFDRYINVAPFKLEDPLYPIARAWISNPPVTPSDKEKPKCKTPTPELLATSRTEFTDEQWNLLRSDDVYTLPPPKGDVISRIPPPMEKKIFDQKTIDNYITGAQMSEDPDALLQEHKLRWTKIKQHWVTHARTVDARYTDSKDVLEYIYSKTALEKDESTKEYTTDDSE